MTGSPEDEDFRGGMTVLASPDTNRDKLRAAISRTYKFTRPYHAIALGIAEWTGEIFVGTIIVGGSFPAEIKLFNRNLLQERNLVWISTDPGEEGDMKDIWNFFWLFIVLISVMPMVQQKILQARRLGLIRALEKKRSSRVITLIHRQETMKFLGFPVMKYIDINDSEDILRAVRFTPVDMPLDIIIHTPGGLVLSTEQIAMALRRHKAKVTIFVPHYAMSGGTLLCLAADEVAMDENAVLGPVDPQLGEYPASSILKIVKQKEMKDIEDKTLILADVAQKAMDQMRDFVKAILASRMDEETAGKITLTLTEGRWTHDYPVTFGEAEKIGLPVTAGLPDEVYQLMDLFPQAMQQRPSVQYVPIPYKKAEGKERAK